MDMRTGVSERLRVGFIEVRERGGESIVPP